MPLVLTSPPRLPLVAPSILSADFAEMGEECRGVLAAGADLLHLDVMDGHFAPNLTMGPDMCRALRRALPTAFLDVHLMVTDPGIYVEPFLRSGANHITFHIEVLDPNPARDLARRIRAGGATAGLALNPATPAEPVLNLYSHFEMILVMSVSPGFSGQKFMPEVLAKTRDIRKVLRSDQRLEMDGGITPENARHVREAGCDVIVSATAVFGVPRNERGRVISGLRG